jgi:hypothetical protein
LITRVDGSDTHYLKLPNMTEEKRFRTWASALRFFEEHAEAAGVRRRQPTGHPGDEGYDGPRPNWKSGKRPQRGPSPKPKPSKRPRAKRDAPKPVPPAPVEQVPLADGPVPQPPVPMEELILGEWLAREDLALAAAVTLFGAHKWSRICKYVPGRNAKQCRERWFERLDPKVKQGSFSEQEDEVVLLGVHELGRKWSEIAKRLPGRTGSACKNRWNCLSKPKAAIGGNRGCRWTHQECLRLARAVKLHDVGTSLKLCVWDKVAESVATRPAHACRARWVCHGMETLERAAQAEAVSCVADQEEELAEKLVEGIVNDIDKDFGEEPGGPVEEQVLDEEEDSAFAAMLSYYADDPMYGLLAVEELPERDEEFEAEPVWTRSSRWVVGASERVKYRFEPAPTTWQPPITDYMPVTRVRPDTRPPVSVTMRWTAVDKAPAAQPLRVPTAIATGELAAPAPLLGPFERTESDLALCPQAC